MKNKVYTYFIKYFFTAALITIFGFSIFSQQPIQSNSKILYNKKGKIIGFDGESVDITILELHEVEFVHNMIKKHSRIKLQHYPEGCWARAQMIVDMLEANGITSGKAFIELKAGVHEKIVVKGLTRWVYHVAPFVQVKKGESLVNYIIDPALSDKPLEHKDWVKLSRRFFQLKNNRTENYNVYFTNKYHILPVGQQKKYSSYWGIPDLEYKNSLKKGYIKQELQLAREFRNQDTPQSLFITFERVKKRFSSQKSN